MIPAEPAIILRDLRKSYGDKEVLRGIDLEVGAGQVIGYLGPNGAGKTTTVKILIGMLGGYEGEARVCGHDVAAEPLEVKRRIGYVPEAAAMYDVLTPREYLCFIGRLYGMEDAEIERRAVAMLELFGLAGEMDRRMGGFSKGMRQKVLIAAGVIHDPEVIFLDEPLSGLDANAVITVKEIVARFAASGKTVFYCSHVMDVVERVCDRMVILSEGRIIADGSFDELKARSHQGSLERIFTQLTGNGEHQAIADAFVRTITSPDRAQPGLPPRSGTREDAPRA